MGCSRFAGQEAGERDGSYSYDDTHNALHKNTTMALPGVSQMAKNKAMCMQMWQKRNRVSPCKISHTGRDVNQASGFGSPANVRRVT